LRSQSVEVGRFYHFIAHKPNIRSALLIGNNQQHIFCSWPFV
jgi:hypothetical protein